MYPVGIRVIAVTGLQIGMTGTVCHPNLGRHPFDDLSVQFDGVGHTLNGRVVPAGSVWSCHSRNWRPINPDADDVSEVEDKELEEVL